MSFGTAPAATGGLSFGSTPSTQTGGFNFGGNSTGGLQLGKPVATVASTPQTGGLTLGSGTSTGFSFNAAATPSTKPAGTTIMINCIFLNIVESMFYNIGQGYGSS